MIDSEWFYRELEKDGRSLRAMARALGLDPSAVSRMLKGERKMSADEQDGIADYLGVSINEVAARRRGEAAGFAEKGQEAFVMDRPEVSAPAATSGGQDAGEAKNLYERIRGKMKGTVTVPPGVDLTEPTWRLAEEKSYYETVRGCMKGTITVAPGVDLTEPADPEWARVYDD